MTWKALSNATQDSGAPSIDYTSFDARWKQEEQLPPEQQILHNLVDRYDGTGLVIKTTKQEPGVHGDEIESNAASKNAQMARHAIDFS
jgi:hypothetical protein